MQRRLGWDSAERYGTPEELHSRRNSMQWRTHDPCEQTFPVPISLAPWETETNFIDSGSTIARRFQVTSKQEAIFPPIITEKWRPKFHPKQGLQLASSPHRRHGTKGGRPHRQFMIQMRVLDTFWWAAAGSKRPGDAAHG